MILWSVSENQLMLASSTWHIRGIIKKASTAKNKRIESSIIYIQDDSAPVRRLEKQCQVFRNANVVKGRPLGGGTWPALNHNDIYAAHPLKLSKYFLPCLCVRQIFWCKIFLLSNRMFLIFVLVSEHRWLVRGWMAAILAVMFKWLFIWMECELNCQSHDNKPCKLITMSLNASRFCSLRCNLRATRNCIVTFLHHHGCLETKTINRTISVRDDHKLTLLLPQVSKGSLPINKSNYITTLQSCLAFIGSDCRCALVCRCFVYVCVYNCSSQCANLKTQQNDKWGQGTKLHFLLGLIIGMKSSLLLNTETEHLTCKIFAFDL